MSCADMHSSFVHNSMQQLPLGLQAGGTQVVVDVGVVKGFVEALEVAQALVQARAVAQLQHPPTSHVIGSHVHIMHAV